MPIKSHILLNAQTMSQFPRMGGDVVKHGDGVVHFTGKYIGKDIEKVYGGLGDYLVTYEDGKKEILSKKAFEEITGQSTDIIVEQKQVEIGKENNESRPNATSGPEIRPTAITGNESGLFEPIAKQPTPELPGVDEYSNASLPIKDERGEIVGEQRACSQEGSGSSIQTSTPDLTPRGHEGESGEQDEVATEANQSSIKRGPGRPPGSGKHPS